MVGDVDFERADKKGARVNAVVEVDEDPVAAVVRFERREASRSEAEVMNPLSTS